jgi:uncharacterized membrane protein
MITRLACVMLFGWIAIGCTADPEPYEDGYGNQEPEPADECVDSPPFERVTAFDKCVNCHSSAKSGPDRKAAPASVNFDTAAAADTAAEDAAGMVRSGAMPPRASGLVLTDLEKQQLYAWASCR